ncbi:MAG TPA: LytTR family DNA-binding domain-containing protein [Xanthomonadales bacterium]|nr:LytTR family DNA-binding domain-containing protein [Xanthomonadales bacterium]
MTIRTLIADDEPLARELLANWVRQDPNLRLVGEASDGDEALELAEKTRAQLLFLDIEMPASNGVDALRLMRTRGLDTYVVFVTAWDQHAVKAYDLEAGDYLVKPVRKARFANAVSRAKRALAQRSHYESLRNALPAFMVREGDKVIPLDPAQIVWVEAASQYARVHTREDQHLISRPLADIQSELPDTLFLRVHRSALVNVSHVSHMVSEQGSHKLEMSSGCRIPIARSRREQVISELKRTGIHNGNC